MSNSQRNLAKALLSVALIVAGPVCAGLLAHEHLLVSVAWAIGMFVTMAGIALLGSLVKQAS